MRKRQEITVQGIVQGVGFRPFIYNLASRYSITGEIRNTSNGVTIFAQGTEQNLEQFILTISSNHPPLAKPEIISVEDICVIEDELKFTIEMSQTGTQKRISITSDAATCEDCLNELSNPTDRRYRYPFINCTNCGPRYTIVFDVPYDRPNTTMSEFKMCNDCQSEYDNPSNRRFHAQPNACPKCGPQLWLCDSEGKKIDTKDPVAKAVKLLESGSIIAAKGLGGFHLAARADTDEPIRRLRERKYRKAKAFAVMVKDIKAVHSIAEIGKICEKLLTGAEHPIVLCAKKQNDILSELVAPSSRFWGIMLPYTPLHKMLMDADYPALVMTSGNNTDEPIESMNNSATNKLAGIADYYLMHNRAIYTRCDDSVAKIFRGEPLLLRRARGYVPVPIKITRKSNLDILAVGAELKNTITYLKNNEAFVSQHIGDLKTNATYDTFLRTIEKLGALTEARPVAVACDLHPAMLSTKFAKTYKDLSIIPVQHHHAHIAAVMGEYDINGTIVGLSVDGVGYGTDGAVWGCELLTARRDSFERSGHLDYIPMPGADAASKEPWRMAVSYLISTLGFEKGTKTAKELLEIEPAKINAIAEILKSKINCPSSSSMGRFFDAVSAISGVCFDNSYEAQAAIELENIADKEHPDAYIVNITEKDGMLILAYKPVVEQIIADIQNNVSVPVISARFHNFVVEALAMLAKKLAEKIGTNIVAISGGVFQSDLILDRLVTKLESENYRVFFNRRLPVNDGTISFGQAIVADAVLAKREKNKKIHT